MTGTYKKIVLFYLAAIFVFFLARVALLLLYWDNFVSLTTSQMILSFVKGARFDISSISVFFSIPLMFMAFPARFCQKRSWQSFWAWIVYIVLIAMMMTLVGDMIYFGFVKRHTEHDLFLVNQGDVKRLWLTALESFKVFLLFIGLGIAVLALFFRKIDRIVVKRGIKKRYYILYFVFFFVLGTLIRGGLGYKPIAVIDSFVSGDIKEGNLILNGVFTISHALVTKQDVNPRFFSEDDVLEILDLTPDKVINPEFPYQQRFEKKVTHYNVVLVLVESLSFKYVDAFGGESYGVTPNLDRLARGGMMFTNFYATSQRSVEGIQAVFTGLPSMIGVPILETGLSARYSGIANVSEKFGYSTIFVRSAVRRALRIDAVALSAGFDEFYGKEDTPIIYLDYPDPEAAMFGWDYDMLMLLADKLETIEKPFVSSAFTATMHGPPFPPLPERFNKLPANGDDENAFLNVLYYTDWSIGEFMKRCEKQAWFDQTIFIFSADHALPLYNVKYAKSHKFNQNENSHHRLFRIPFVIYAPKILEPRVINEVASQLDVFPTLMDLLGLDEPFSSFGESVLQPKHRNFAVSRNGPVMGIVTKDAYLWHSMKNRLDAKSIGSPVGDDYFNALEKKLLASVQLVNQLTSANKWATE